MAVVGLALFLGHGEDLELFLYSLQTRSLGVFFHSAGLEIVHPFLKRCLGDLVVSIDADEEILREYLAWKMRHYHAVFLGADYKVGACMDALEFGGAAVDVVIAFPEFAIEDAY